MGAPAANARTVTRRLTGIPSRARADWLMRVPSWLPLTAIVGVAFGVTAIWVRSVHTFGVMPDEIGYIKQSLQIARTGLLVGPHGYFFNSWGQLLPLLSAPVFGGLGMVDAFYAAHTLYALVLASAAVPAYLIARSLGLGRLAANLAAALSVAVPWMLLAGVIMTEDVAYPAFAWAMLAFLRAIQQPGARRDLLALAGLLLACFARTQFLVLGPALVTSVLVHDLQMALCDRGRTGRRAALVAGLRGTLAGHRVLWTISAMALAGVLVAQLTGSASSVLGNYVSADRGNLLPSGTVAAGLEQLDSTAVAIGVAPLALAAVWALATIRRPRDPGRHAYAVLMVVTIVACGLLAGSFQQQFLGGSTTDLYMFEVAPLLFVGTVAWVVDRRGSLPGLALVGAGTIWLALADTLHDRVAFSIINPSLNFQHALIGDSAALGHALGIGELDARIPLVVLAAALVLAAAATRRRAPAWVALLVVTLPLLAYGTAGTGYAMTKVAEQLAPITADHPQELTWIDRAIGPGADAGLVLASNGSLENTYFTWWQPYFWNKSVQRAFALPGASNLAQGFVGTLTPDLAAGRLLGLDGVRYLVKLDTDTRFGLPERPLNPNGELVIFPITTDRLLYGTRGVLDTGALVWASHPVVRVFDDTSRPVTERVTLVIGLTGRQRGCPCRLSAGAGQAGTPLPGAAGDASHTMRLHRMVTISPGGHADLPLSLRGQGPRPASVGAELLSVKIAQG